MPSADIPQRPYLLRAMHAWITDNGQTPHVLVDATVEGIQVPAGYVQDGRIVLNVSYDAVAGLDIGNDIMSFEARFSGAAHRILVPVSAVLGIYAQESGRGMIFGEVDGTPPPPPPAEPDGPPTPGSGRPHLKVVK